MLKNLKVFWNVTPCCVVNRRLLILRCVIPVVLSNNKNKVMVHMYIVKNTTSCVFDYTGCHRRNGPNFGRVFLMLNYTDITQNTYTQS